MKILNSKCICDCGLAWKNDIIVMVLPCEHLYHLNCINIYLSNFSNRTCLYCNSKIENIVSKLDNLPNKQQKIDMLSVTNYDKGNYFVSSISENIIHLLSIFGILSISPLLNMVNINTICNSFFSLINAKISVDGLEKIKDKKKIFIAKHVCYLDIFIIYYVLKCGFVSSSFTQTNIIGKNLLNLIPSLVIERGKSSNTVDKIKQYVKEHNDICIFPEGMFSHPKTLVKFRTGAFVAGFPIYSVIITYNPCISDGNMGKYLLKLTSQTTTYINVKIIGPYYPPFTDDKIESIRKDMGKIGNMQLSRVSNRDYVD